MKNKKLFLNIIENSKFFYIQHNKLLDTGKINNKVLNILINYFILYIKFYNLSNEEIYNINMDFLNEFKLHLKEFKKTNKYPYQYNALSAKNRFDYDIPLLCSTFLTYHRYCIFETLYNKINIKNNQRVLVVGVGSGIELAVLRSKSKNIYAYDTDIGDFIKNYFQGVRFINNSFNYEPGNLYNKIILIEILEHLENPEQLLLEAMKSLKTYGRIHFTTAVNIPQFDHLYNFELNDKKLEDCILKNGFEVEFKLNIPHNLADVNAFNCYYIIKRKIHK